MHFHLTKYLLKIFRILFIVHSLSNFWEDCLLLTEVLNQNFEIGICDFDIKDDSSKKYNLYTFPSTIQIKDASSKNEHLSFFPLMYFYVHLYVEREKESF